MTQCQSIGKKRYVYLGKDCVVISNGVSLPISHTNTFSPTSLLKLLDVLVVRGLIKNIISISKLINDFPYYITFIKDLFCHIEFSDKKGTMVTNQCENGLYMLKCGHHSLISTHYRMLI